MNSIQARAPESLRPDAPDIGGIAQLGGRGALYLLALMRAHQLRERIAPTLEASKALLTVLDAIGTIQIDVRPTPQTKTTIGDRLPWSYTWLNVPTDLLQLQLVEYLTSVGRGTLYANTWLRVWEELIPAEVISYLQKQLSMHQFSHVFVSEIVPLLATSALCYSLGQWRYACWASVRTMTSVSLQFPGNVELLKLTLANELPRRLQVASRSSGEKFCFAPANSTPACALTTVLSTVATQLNETFWKSPPDISLI